MRHFLARNGDTRIVYKFLWLPVITANEWRWLERAAVAYVRIGGWWVADRFVD